MTQPQQPQPQEQPQLPIEPGHVMSRQRYERLVREQKPKENQ